MHQCSRSTQDTNHIGTVHSFDKNDTDFSLNTCTDTIIPIKVRVVIGEIIGHNYKLLALLGRGGMGAVYEAICQSTSARVAVKVLHHHLADGEPAQRFRREADAARRINSEHIVRIIDAGTCTSTGHLFLVTELLDGCDLQQWLDRYGPLAIRGALRLVAQALRGLSEAHAARVIHRDIKPANLFLARQPNGAYLLKILDFGIAKVQREPFSHAMTTDMTATGNLLGSPMYMSPEQVQDSRRVDIRTDIWSLGSVFYAALAGCAPHQHLSTLGQLLVAICVHPAKPIATLAPWVPVEIATIVHKSLEIDPAARYATANEMLSDVEKFVTDGDLVEEDLLSSGSGFRAVYLSSTPPSEPNESSRVVVGSNQAFLLGNESTMHAHPPIGLSDTEVPPRAIERSAVPKLDKHVVGRHVTVDPRRILGDQSELWTLSLDVHRDLSTLLSRVWKALRRGGAKVPPMSYGVEWVLYEPRTQRFVTLDHSNGEKKTLEDAGIRSGGMLWVVHPSTMNPQN